MPTSNRLTLAAPIIIALLCVAGGSLHAAGSSTLCNTLSLSEKPSWISSAVWVDALQDVAIVDALRSKVLILSPNAEAQPLEDAGLTSSRVRDFFPVGFGKFGTGYFLKLLGSRALALDSSLNVTGELDLAQSVAGTSNGLRSLYQWTVAGNTLVGFGSITAPEAPDGFRLGFLTMPLETRDRVSLVFPFASGDHYVLGHQYITTLGPDAYFLLMGSQPRIYRLTLGSKEGTPTPLSSNTIPAGFGKTPPITTPMTGPDSAKALFAEIETLAMPVGLYGYDGYLYLLTRQPEANRVGTIWSLFKIDPKGERVVARLRLPTSANHVYLVPSPKNWFIFERGKVHDGGQQKIATVVRIPSNWITEGKAYPLNPTSSTQKVHRCPVKN